VESFSVATIIRPSTTNGCAYTAPSRGGDRHASRSVLPPAPAVATPDRPASCWYVSHAPPASGDGEVVAFGDAGVELDEGAVTDGLVHEALSPATIANATRCRGEIGIRSITSVLGRHLLRPCGG